MTVTATRTRKAATGTDTAPRTSKASKVPTITHGPAGTVLINLPYIVPGHGQSRMHMHVKANPDALGWTYTKEEINGYVMDDSAGKASADMARVRECVDYWRERGVIIDVKLTSTGKARATRTVKDAAPVADLVQPATPARSRKSKMPVTVAPTPDSVSLAEVISSALMAAGMPADVIAAAVMGVSATVKEHARSARNAEVKAPVKRAPSVGRASARTAGPGKASAGKSTNGVKITMGDDGARCYTLPVGARTRAVATAVRKALYADMRARGVVNVEAWTVKADRDTRTLSVYRHAEDGVWPNSEHDPVILPAIKGALA